MIKFFRKIRQQLLSENKFSKYLLYAIGEIVLVVIGILIALQIGKINEQGKKQEQSIVIKQALKTELQADLELMQMDLDYMDAELKRNRSFAKRLSHVDANVDTLVKIVRKEYFIGLNGVKELDQTTFKSLESTGTIILLGNDLANKVQKYYMYRESNITAIETNLDIYYNLMETFMMKYPNDSFAINGNLQDEYWKNADLNGLNGMFNGLLTSRLFNLNVRQRILKESVDSTHDLVNQLD